MKEKGTERKISLVTSLRELSLAKTRGSLFLFFILFFLSAGFFVTASDHKTSDENFFEDTDQDGLSNDEEKLYGTDPYKKDTDGDGYGDGIEVESGYDPLKRAPGDKIVHSFEEETNEVFSEAGGDNLTEKVSQEIAGILKDVSEGEGSMTMEEVNELVENALAGNMEEVVLPEIDTTGIKIKKTPRDGEEVRQDVLEYVTVMAYMMANSSPIEFRTEEEAGNLITTLTEESGAALLSGNMEYLDELAEQGGTILKEAKSIEVPEVMYETHVKALRLASYAIELKKELKSAESDPLGLIAVLSKAQGLIAASESFSEELLQKMDEYGVEEIPINF